MKKAETFFIKAVYANTSIQITMADLLKQLSLKQCPVANVLDPDLALSHIFNQEFPDEKSKRKFVEIYQKPKIFQSRNPHIFKPLIVIDSLDIPLLGKILKKTKCFLANGQQVCQRLALGNKPTCCDGCFHPCPLCNKEECEADCANRQNNVWDHQCKNPNCLKNKTVCIDVNCHNCVNNPEDDQCGVANVICGIDVSIKNRSNAFHLTLSKIVEFMNGKRVFDGFPDCHNEDDLFKCIQQSYVSIVNFISNRKYFPSKAITFKDRRERISEMTAILIGEPDKDLREDLREVTKISITLHYPGGLLIENFEIKDIEEFTIIQHNAEGEQFIAPTDLNIKYDDTQHKTIVEVTHDIVSEAKYDYKIFFEDNEQKLCKASIKNLVLEEALPWLQPTEILRGGCKRTAQSDEKKRECDIKCRPVSQSVADMNCVPKTSTKSSMNIAELNENSYFSKDMTSYLKDKMSSETTSHRELSYWLAHKVREEGNLFNQEHFHKTMHESIQSSLNDRMHMGNHIDLDCWLSMFFDSVLAGDAKKEKFPLKQETVDKWFKAKSKQCTIWCANVNYECLDTFVKDNSEFDLTCTNAKKLWFHGTSHAGAEKIRTGGISLMRNTGKTDFGDGFYMSPSFFYAKNWASRKPSNYGKGAIIIYHFLSPERFAMLDLTDNEKWKDVVDYARRGENTHVEDEIYESDYIMGKISKDITLSQEPSCKQTEPNRMQICVKSRKLAKELNASIKGIIYMG